MSTERFRIFVDDKVYEATGFDPSVMRADATYEGIKDDFHHFSTITGLLRVHVSSMDCSQLGVGEKVKAEFKLSSS